MTVEKAQGARMKVVESANALLRARSIKQRKRIKQLEDDKEALIDALKTAKRIADEGPDKVRRRVSMLSVIAVQKDIPKAWAQLKRDLSDL